MLGGLYIELGGLYIGWSIYWVVCILSIAGTCETGLKQMLIVAKLIWRLKKNKEGGFFFCVISPYLMVW